MRRLNAYFSGRSISKLIAFTNNEIIKTYKMVDGYRLNWIHFNLRSDCTNGLPSSTTRERLNKDGLKETLSRVPQKWFVEGDKAKYYYFCENAVKNISLETADNALIAMKNWRGYENLKNIKQDTLIIWGDKDVSYNFDQVDILKKNISSSQLEIFEGCGHNVHLEEPQKFNETVKNFLS